jgi:hypothetical protein
MREDRPIRYPPCQLIQREWRRSRDVRNIGGDDGK